MKTQTIFTRFLKALGVRHTNTYSDKRFEGMTFKSLFGLSHLLSDYGIDSDAWNLEDTAEVKALTLPYLAQKKNGVFIIVRSYDTSGNYATYDESGKLERVSIEQLKDSLNGIVMTAYPDRESIEPDYRTHAISDLVNSASSYLLIVSALVILGYFFITRKIYESPATILLALLDCLGLWLSYMLMQKSLGIHTATSERVCGVIEKGGCDVITNSAASKLFGIFSWSEIGFSYFSVSLVTLLVFPHLWPALALCNICCLPYTLWSISYQKFVAHHWCTLCVGVQLTLWLLFFSYLWGGMTARIFPLHFDLLILVSTYVLVVLFLHKIIEIFKNIPKNESDS